MPHDITVYVKASPDGTGRGDCPFCHKVLMWLHLKGIEHTEVFIDLKAKPDWFLDISKTRCTPVMKIDDKIVEDSEAILDFLEHHTPAEPDLKSTQVALDVCPRILPIFKDYYFNQDEDKEEELKKAFDLQMVELHKYLDSVQHSYLSGEHPTRADCSLAPKLFHALTVLRNVKHYKIPPDAPSAKEYTDRIFSHKDFKESGYPKDYVLHGWAEKLKASK